MVLIKFIIAVAVIVFLRIFIWRTAKSNPSYQRLGNNAIRILNYASLLLLGCGAITIIFSYPDYQLGLIIGGVLGIIGALISM